MDLKRNLIKSKKAVKTKKISNQFLYSLLLFFLFASNIIAQSTFDFEGKVIDAPTLAPIPFANILIVSDENKGIVCDENGNFSGNTSAFPIQCLVSAVGYQTLAITLEKEEELIIQLTKRTNLLSEIEVTAKNKIIKLNDEKYIPVDFALAYDHVFLLSHTGTLGRQKLEVFNNFGLKIKSEIIKSKRIKGFRVTCLGGLYLEYSDYMVLVEYDNEKLTPVEKMEIADYNSLFNNCKDSDEDNFLLEYVNLNGLVKNYLLVNRNNSKQYEFKQVYYKEILDSYFQDIGFLNWGTTLNNMGEISKEENEYLRNIQEDADFCENFIYKNTTQNYTSILTENGPILFNFDESKVEIFDSKGNETFSSEILFNQYKLNSKNEVVVDEELGIFYFIGETKTGVVLHQISEDFASISNSVQLDLKSYKRIEIINGVIYALGIKNSKITNLPDFFYQRIG